MDRRNLLVGIVSSNSLIGITMSINIPFGFWVIISLFVWMVLEILIIYISNKKLIAGSFDKEEDITPESREYNVRALTLSGLTFAGITLLIDAYSENIQKVLDVIIILLYGFGLFLSSYKIEVLTNYKRLYWVFQEKLLNFGFLSLIFSLLIFFYGEKLDALLYVISVFVIVIIAIHFIEFKKDYEYYSSRRNVVGEEMVFDEEGFKNFYSECKRLWIDLEIEKRKRLGREFPDKIERILIRFLKEKTPIVEFNNEFKIIANITPRISEGERIEKGEELHLEDIAELKDVEPVNIDGKPCCFIFFTFKGTKAYSYFNFRPSHEDFDPKEWKTEMKKVARFLSQVMIDTTVGDLRKFNDTISPYDWWINYSIIPEPLNRMIEAINKGKNRDEIDKIVIDYFTAEKLNEIRKRWFLNQYFKDRGRFLNDAIDAHIQKKYTLSIPVLSPHIEGILTDWILGQKKISLDSFRDKKKWFKNLQSGLEGGFITDYMLDFLFEYLDKTSLFAGFEWSKEDGVTLNRHKLAHGKRINYDTELNSLKVILLLDSVFHIIHYRS